MSKMSDIDMEIRDLLDTTMLSCAEIAEQVGCPVDWVNSIVEERWEALLANQEFQNGYDAYKDAYQGA
jgi:hypothetical protein